MTCFVARSTPPLASSAILPGALMGVQGNWKPPAEKAAEPAVSEAPEMVTVVLATLNSV